MFQLDLNALNEEIATGGNAINKSGCYNVSIAAFKKVKASDSNSMSQGFNVTFETENGQKAWTTFWYKGKNGQKVEFQYNKLTALIYLMGINGINENQTDNNKNIANCLGKKLGIVLEVSTSINKQDGKMGYDYTLVGAYDINTKQTAHEKYSGKPPKAYSYFVNKYANAEEIVLKQTANNNQSNNNQGFGDDAFPINTDDIPF